MKLWKTAMVTVLVAAGLPATASAEGPVETSGTWATCHSPNIVNPFIFDGDFLNYVLAPSGSFEGAAEGWQYEDGAKVVAGDDGFGLQFLGQDEQILSLPADSEATSPEMCVDLHYPTFRFAVRSVSGADDDLSELEVELKYPDATKAKYRKWREITEIEADPVEGWQITEHLPLSPENGGTVAGPRKVALRFIVNGDDDGTAYEIDDVYVDPRSRH